jgi:hypothetical protein
MAAALETLAPDGPTHEDVIKVVVGRVSRAP